MRVFCFSALLALLVSGCATNSQPEPPTNQDPWEGFNRKAYKFNRAVDEAVLKPAAKGYQAITPQPVEAGVGNFFSNLGEVSNLFNNLLQFKLKDAAKDTGRLLINSTLGIGGLFDPATRMGLEANDEDFGQTLAVWGVSSGPYLMLPLFGPSTVRDAFGRPVESYLNPVRYVNDDTVRFGLFALELIDVRAELLELEGQLKQALDEYAFVRDAYLQRREFLIYDGEVPVEDDFEDFCDPDDEECF